MGVVHTTNVRRRSGNKKRIEFGERTAVIGRTCLRGSPPIGSCATLRTSTSTSQEENAHQMQTVMIILALAAARGPKRSNGRTRKKASRDGRGWKRSSNARGSVGSSYQAPTSKFSFQRVVAFANGATASRAFASSSLPKRRAELDCTGCFLNRFHTSVVYARREFSDSASCVWNIGVRTLRRGVDGG